MKVGDKSKSDHHKMDHPKADKPKADKPKADKPKADKPKAEAKTKPTSAPGSTSTSKTAVGHAWDGKSGFDATPAKAGAVKLSGTSMQNTVAQPGVGAPFKPGARPLSEGSQGLELTISKPEAGAGQTQPQAGAPLESSQPIGTTSTSAIDGTSLEPVQTEPIPSSTGTAVITGNELSKEEKLARGALEIQPGEPASTYDGMYIGRDGFAYPPDKFKITEVPPFTPEHPISNPPSTTYFVNGILTGPEGAMKSAGELANRTGTNVVPIYNATSGNVVGDSLQTGADRIAQGDNPAVNTLRDVIAHDLEQGLNVNVVGYSQGGAIVSSALQQLDRQLPPEQRANLAHLNVVGIASAGKIYPPGPQYTFYVNQYDAIPNSLGVHPVNPLTDPALAIIGANPVENYLNAGGPGYSAPGATVHVISDPANPLDPLSPHYIDTYFQHIPER